jgi:RNA polymerase sigma-70 factor, ECF subfamily
VGLREAESRAQGEDHGCCAAGLVEAGVNTSSRSHVYDWLGGLFRMALTSEGRIALLATGAGDSPPREHPRSETSEDQILVAAARRGDRAAFGRLYDLYAGLVHGVLLAKVPLDAVDDLLQDVFVTALRRLSTLREPGSFGAWLAAIARNRANDYHRRTLPEDQLTDEPLDQDIQGASPHADQEGQAAAILAAIQSLSRAYRETLILRLVEGMTGPEIAARTGMTHGSVRVNLHRGMQQLRAKLRSHQDRDSPQEETR